MFIYGGIDGNSNYLNDVWEFYFAGETTQWKHCSIDIDETLNDDYGIAFHTICPVFDQIFLYNRLNERMEELTNPFYAKEVESS
jgi:hypothetical protein